MYETLLKKKLVLVKALEKISEIELPCYSAVDATGYNNCNDKDLCGACKVHYLVEKALINDDKPDKL